MNREKPLVALITNHDDDIYCFRKELIEGLIESGYDILISCPYGEKFELLKHIDYIYDDPYIDRRGTNIITDFKLFRHYKKLFKKHRPDVVLTYTAKPNVYASIAAKQLKIPYINNVTGFGSLLFKQGLMKKFIMTLFRYAYSSANFVMFQNESNMELAKSMKLVKGECVLIPGSGVNTDHYFLQEYPHGGNGIEGETVVFNYIGRVLREKGVDDYIAAATIIKQKYPNTEFNIIGFVEPTESHYIEQLATLKSQNIINYFDNQKDVRPFIKRSHAIILPSYGEGMSNVLLENASSGRFIITTDNPGCRDTLIDKKTGYIYKSADVNELVDRIEKFLALDNDTRKAMGEQGREFVKENFSRSIVVDAYRDKIGKILADK